MALSAGRFTVEQSAEEIAKETQHRWLNAAELCKIFENYEKLQILACQPQQRPTSGSFFVIKLRRLSEFKKDGHVWSKKKDGKTIQESHEDLKVNGVVKLNCNYAYLETNENFQRRIYRMFEECQSPLGKLPSSNKKLKGRKYVGIALFHYIEDKLNRKKTIKVTHQSSQEARKAIHTLVLTDSLGSSGIVDYGNNQLSLPLQTRDTINLENIQGNAKCAGCSSGIVNHGNYQLSLAPKNTDSINQSNIQANAEFAVCGNQPSSGFHYLPDLQQNLMEITDAEYSGSHNLRNKSNHEGASDIPAELLANTSNGYQDCMFFLENPDCQEFYLWLKKLDEGENNLTAFDAGVIHLAVAFDYTSVLQHIFGVAKIDINLSDKNGYTALHWAAKYGRMHTVEFLISQGANPLLPSFPGGNTPDLDSVTGTLADLDFPIDTPASLAYDAGHNAVGKYLEEKAEAAQAALTFDDDEFL